MFLYYYVNCELQKNRLLDSNLRKVAGKMFFFHRMKSAIPKRRMFDVVRGNFCSDPKLIKIPSNLVNQSSSHGFIKQLQKMEESIAKNRSTTIREVVSLLDAAWSSSSLNESQALILLKCCGETNPSEVPSLRTELAKKIWLIINKMKVQPNIHLHNELLEIYLQNEHPFAWTEVMNEIRTHRLEPDQRTYELIFERLCRFESMQEAFKFIDGIKANGFKFTEAFYCSKMFGYTRVGDMTSAVEVPNEMRRQGVTQTVRTAVTLMQCYARSGDIDNIIEILNSHMVEYTRFQNADILSVIVELCLNGHESKIDPLVLRMIRHSGYYHRVHTTIIMLLRRGKVDGAYTLLKTMPRATLPNGQLFEIGSFFLKYMMNFDHSVHSIIAMSRRITADGLNSRAIYIVLEHALHAGNVNVSIAALKELRQLREPIRQHYFWPLLCSEAVKGKEDLYQIIRQMRSEFQLTPDAQTVANFILSPLKKLAPEQITEELRELGISMENIVPAIVLNCLKRDDIEGACKTAVAHASIYYPAQGLRKPLTLALTFSRDYASFARLVRIIRDSQPLGQDSLAENANDTWTMKEIQLDLVGSILFDAITNLRDLNSIDLVLRSFIGETLLISAKQMAQIKSLLSKMESCRDIVQFIDVLTVPNSQAFSERSRRTDSNDKIGLQSKSKQITELMVRMEVDDVEGAIRTWKKLKSNEVMIQHYMQQFVDFLLKNNRFKETQDALKQAVTTKIRLSDQTWQDVLYRLAADTNLAALDEFKHIEIDQSVVPLDILNNAYCTAFTLNGAADKYLSFLENQANAAEKATDLQHFPRNSAITILSKHPELLGAYKSLVKKYLDKNCTVPLNALWMYYFVTGNDTECTDIWSNTLSMVPEFSYDCILQVARTNHDAHLAGRLLNFFRSEEMEIENWIAAYNALLDIHISNREFEEAKIVIEYAVWDECYEHIDHNVLLNISHELMAMGQTFPYKISTKVI